MNIRQIEHLVAIVEYGSYRSAASHLGVSQPALTKSITALETELGVNLLNRSRGKPADLTVFGRVIYERGLKMLEDIGQTRRSIELLRDGYTGDIRIGFGAAMAPSMIAGLCSVLQSRLPNSMIHIRTGLQHELLPRLRTNQLDFLIMSGISHVSTDDLSIISLWQDPFMVFVAGDHELASHTVYNPEWATSYNWLSSERLVSTDNQAMTYLGHSARTVSPSQIDVFEPAIIAEILRRGQYLSAWPSRSFQSEVARGALHALKIPAQDGAEWSSETHLIAQKGVRMTPAVQSAWRALQSVDLSSDLSLVE